MSTEADDVGLLYKAGVVILVGSFSAIILFDIVGIIWLCWTMGFWVRLFFAWVAVCVAAIIYCYRSDMKRSEGK